MRTLPSRKIFALLSKSSAGGIYRVILKARKILMYTEVHEFFETAQNHSRKPLDEFL